MSRSIYSSLDDAFQPLNPKEQSLFHSQREQREQRGQQEERMKSMWSKEGQCQGKDFSEIYDRMNQGQELPPYCAKENNQFKEFQRKSNEDREKYLQNMGNVPRPQLSNDYQDMELGMYRLRNSTEDSQALVKVPNGQKVFLEKRLAELERELKKYQFLLRVFDEEERGKRTPKIMNSNGEDDSEYLESFGNFNNDVGSHNKSDDLIDLIVLLAIGLLIIFVLDSVFKMGKSISAKK
jgi:hypothetical protein